MMLKLLTILCFVFLLWSTYHDYRYNEFLSVIPFILMSLISLVVVIANGGEPFMTVLGWASLALILYVTCVVENRAMFGTIDILIAPCFTVWFGGLFIPYLVIFILTYLVSHTALFRKVVFKVESPKDPVPLIPVLMLNFIIGIILLPNVFLEIIFS